MTEYQKGINELQNLFRKYGVILFGEQGLKEGYHKFLVGHGMKPRKGTRKQILNLRSLAYYGFPPTKASKTITGVGDSTTEVITITMK